MTVLSSQKFEEAGASPTEGILHEFFPNFPSVNSLNEAQNRVSQGKASINDLDLLDKQLIRLVTQTVLDRLTDTSPHHLNSNEAIETLLASGMPLSMIKNLGVKLHSNKLLSDEDAKSWEILLSDPQELKLKESLSKADSVDLENATLKVKLQSEVEQKLDLERVLSTREKQLEIASQSRREVETREEELRSRTADLEVQLGEKSKRITETTLELVTAKQTISEAEQRILLAYEDRATLLQRIAELEAALSEGGSKTNSPKKDVKSPIADQTSSGKEINAEPATKAEYENLRAKWQIFSETLFGPYLPVKPRTKEKMNKQPFTLQEEDLAETQAHFSAKGLGKSNRMGLLAGIISFSSGVSFANGEGISKLNDLLANLGVDERNFLGNLVEHLAADPKLLKALYPLLARDFTYGVEKKSPFSSYNTKKSGWITRIPKEFGSEKERGLTEKAFLNIEGTIDSLSSLHTILTELEVSIPSPVLAKLKKQVAGLQSSTFASSLSALSTSKGEPPDERWTKYNRLVKDSTENEPLLAKLNDLDKLSKKERADFEEALTFLSLAFDLAHFHSQLPKDARPATAGWNPNGGDIQLKKSRNLNSVIISLIHGGAAPASLTEEAMLYDNYSADHPHYYSWPPPENPPKTPNLKEALSHEIPVSLELTPDRPIIVLAGHNGAGKTHAMETLLQSIGGAEATHVVHLGELLSPRQSRVRGLIGATAHSDRLSSFQNEATHLRSVFESFSKLKAGDTAVLAIDEVGKGTDSRDALALMAAAGEYCRRRGIFLVMATHHSREFLRISDMIGLRPYIRILSPDHQTHQLMEYNESVPSDGVEVFGSRPMIKEGIDDKTSSVIIANAIKIREATLANARASVETVKLPEPSLDGNPLPFIDPESAADMGVSVDGVSSLKFITENVWLGDKNYRLHDIAQGIFLKGFVEQMSRNYSDVSKPLRLNTINKMDNLFTATDKERLLSQASAVSALSATFHFDPTSVARLDKDESLDSMVAKVTSILNTGDPLSASGLYSTEEVDKLFSAWSAFRDSSTHTAMREQSLSLAKSLKEAAPDLANKINRLVILETEAVDSIVASSDKQRSKLLGQAIKKSAESNLPYQLKNYLDTKDVQDLAKALGLEPPDYASDSWITSNLLTPYLADDSRVKNALVKYVSAKASAPFADYKTKSLDVTLRPERAISELIFKRVIDSNKLSEFSKYFEARGLQSLPDNKEQALAIYLAASDLQGATAVLAGFDFLAANKIKLRYSSYGIEEMAYRAQTFADFTYAEEVLNWQERLSNIMPSKMIELAIQDLYGQLGHTYGDDLAAMRRDMGRVSMATHPDIQQQEPDLSKKRQMMIDYDQTQRAWEIIGNPKKKAEYDDVAAIQVGADLGFYLSVAYAHDSLAMVTPERPADGQSLSINGGIPLGLLSQMSRELIIPQDISLPAGIQACVIGGANGNGKSQLLQTVSNILLWDRQTGKVPAQHAVIPDSIPFIMSQINAGETTPTKSSWQNESDRIAQLLHRYTRSGSPKGGYLFFDEPGAGTSPEDQIGVILSIIALAAQQDVKVIFTNHNHLMYQQLLNLRLGNGDRLSWKPIAYLHDDDPKQRYTPREFDPERTEAIRSDGIKVAAQYGVPEEIIQLASFVRELMEGRLDAEPTTETSADFVIGLFSHGDIESVQELPPALNLPESTQIRLINLFIEKLDLLQQLAEKTSEKPSKDKSLTQLSKLISLVKSSDTPLIDRVSSCEAICLGIDKYLEFLQTRAKEEKYEGMSKLMSQERDLLAIRREVFARLAKGAN